MSLNKVMIIGRLGQDPELKDTQTGKAMCKFSVASTEKYKDRNGQQQDKTEWFNVVSFGRIAEVASKYLAKGREVFIEGSLQTSSYEKDGQKRYMTQVIAKNVQFIGGKSEQKKATQSKPQVNMEFTGEDIPF